MLFYKQHFLSLVKFLDLSAAELSSSLGVAAPVFVNLDAHANETELPKQDFLATSGYAAVVHEKFITIHCQFGVSTYGDKDMLRHIDYMDYMTDRLMPGRKLPVYTAAGGVVSEDNWMIVQNDLLVVPTDKTQYRTLQAINVRFQSGVTGRA